MTKTPVVEILFSDSAMVVQPSTKLINHRKRSGEMVDEVTEALEKPRERTVSDLVIDLSDVSWIGSSGLNELIQLQALTRSSGVSLRLRSLNSPVREVFQITRLERAFEVEGAESDPAPPLKAEPTAG